MLLNKIAGGIAALAVSLPLLVHAAERPDGKPFEVGVRVGAQISNLLTDAKWGPYPDISGPGGMLSADFARGFSDNFYLHAALGLDLRTYYTHIEMSIPCEGDCGGAWDGDEIFSYLYLEIPVMAQWRNSVLFVEAGPVFDVMLFSDKEYVLPEKYRAQSDGCYEDERFGAGVVAGIGHVFGFGLSVDARVSLQLTDVVSGGEKCLTMHSEEVEMRLDPQTGDATTKLLWESDEYMGGSYYRMLKYQLGIGYWF